MGRNAWREYERIAPAILGRELIAIPHDNLRKSISGKRVLVTGAGGFIGSALVRLLAQLEPAGIVLCDNGEHALYEVDRELRETCPAFPVDPVICDIRDQTALARLCETRRPQIVFHAAALKQLPLTEANPREAVLTNVIGTANLVECCKLVGVEALIHISTDKAAEPSCVLGASKRVAELVCQLADNHAAMRCASVRFNNVFGSTGSVVPLFQEQIARKTKLTITHPGMNRYFVTVGEATQLVIAALGLCLDAAGPERPVFLLECGSSLPIIELARRLSRLADPAFEPELEVVGIRSGEKLDESLIAPWEDHLKTALPMIGLACDGRAPLQDLPMLLARLRRACDRFDEGELRQLLAGVSAVPKDQQSALADHAAG